MFQIYVNGESIYYPTHEQYYIVDPHLKLEFGKAGSFEFKIPPTNKYYNKLYQLSTIVTVKLDNEELFRGRILSIDLDFNNFKSVYCEGDLSYLVDSVQKAEAYNGSTHDLFRKIIAAHNARVESYKQFTVGTIGIENRSVILTGQSNDINVGNIDYKQIAIDSIVDDWNNTYDYIQTCLIDYCGGYLRTRRVGDITYIDLVQDYGSTATQSIEFAENLLDLTEEVSAEDLFTVLVPLGDENLTIASVNSGSDELVDPVAVSRYGRIVRTHVFPNVNEASTLLENAQRYLASNVNLPVTITAKAIDMHLLDGTVDAIHIGDRVRINSSPHRLVEYLTCTQIEYDLFNPENNTYTFGNPKQTLTERYREDKRKDADTYGNSGTGSIGSGIGAASAASAAQTEAVAKKQTNELKKEIYEEWIDIDPDNPDGIGSLGGLYRKFKNNEEVLTKQVGIDFNAREGNINLYSMQRAVDEVTNKTSENTASIDVLTEGTKSEIALVTERINDVKNKTDSHYAEFRVWADEKESVIEGKADRLDIETVKGSIRGVSNKVNEFKDTLKNKVGIDFDADLGTINVYSMSEKLDETENKIGENSAALKSLSDETHAEMSMIAQSVDANGERIASLQVWANNKESVISGKADRLELEAVRASITGTNTEVTKMKSVLTNQVGIDFNAVTGNTNIRSLSTKVDEHGRLISNNSARVSTVANDLQSLVLLEAKHYGETGMQIASVQATADSLGSRLNLKANTVDVDADITNINSSIVNINGEIANLKARKITADEINSALAIIDRVAVKNLTASSISSPTISISDVDGGMYPVASKNYVNVTLGSIGRSSSAPGTNHAHVITENSDGTITLGYATSEPQTFDIRATKTYKEGVAAAAASATVKVEDIAVTFGDETYYSNTKIITLPVQVSVKGVNKTVTAQISASEAYRDGYSKGSSAGAETGYEEGYGDVVISSITNSVSESLSNHTITVAATALASNDKTKTVTWTLDAVNHYNAGRISITIPTIERTGETYNKTGTNAHKTSITVKATASNNNTKTQTFVTGSDAYDDGYKNGHTAGANSVNIDSIVRESETYNNTGTNVHKTSITVKASASNGKTLSRTFVTGTQAYDDGYTHGETDGVASVTISSIARRTDVTNEVYSSTSHKTTIYVIATASNGKTRTNYFTTGTAAYDDGLSKGTNSVSITSLTNSVSQSLANHTMTVIATALASNNASRSATWTLDTSSHYTAGANSVSITAITNSVSQSLANHTMTVTATALASNNASRSATWTLDTTSHYTAGANGVGFSGMTVHDSVGSFNDDMWFYSWQTEYEKIWDNWLIGTATVSLSNGATRTYRVGMYTGAAYDDGHNVGYWDGYNDASGNINIGTPYITKVYSYYEHKYYYYANCTVNGTTYTGPATDL